MYIAGLAWLGHSDPLAAKHYLQVTDADFDRAVQSGAESGAVAVRNPVQWRCEIRCSNRRQGIAAFRKKRHKPLTIKGLCRALLYRTHVHSTPRGVEQRANSSGNQGVALQGGAKSGALSGDSAPDPDLMAVVAAWPTLPEAVRQKIVGMVLGE